MVTHIVCVNYRTPQDLLAFVKSFEQAAPKDCVLTIVDVDPVLAFDDMLPHTYMVLKENVGYGRACNAGIKGSDADIYGFFNADIVLKKTTIQDCAGALTNNPEWGILGPYQYDTKGNVTHGGIFGTNDRPVHRGWHKSTNRKYKDVRDDAVMVMGSAFFIKKQCWDELYECPIFKQEWPDNDGLFPNNIFLYYEETTISYHASAHGWKNVYYGAAECVHKWHGSIHRHGDSNAFMVSRDIFRHFCDEHDILHD